MAADKETRKQQLTARRQDQILTAALEIFAQKGYSAATIPEIARQAGLAAGTIYLYFPNKRDLFIKVVENLLVSPLLSIFEKENSTDFIVSAKAALNNRLAFLESGALGRLMLLMSEIQRDPELKSSFNQTLLQPLFKRMSRIFGAQLANGTFRPIDPEIVVRLIGGMMIGLTLMRNIEGESSPFTKLTQAQTAQEIMNFVMRGILNDSLRSTPEEA
jgi:AcrR family transcriptional regulator